MKFNSVKEFFYKLTNSGYQTMMLPLIFFTIYFGQNGFGLLKPFLSNETLVNAVFYLIAASSMFSLTTVQVIFFKRYFLISNLVGLGLKLENYGDEAIRKMRWIATTATLAPLGLFATGDNRLVFVFAGVFVWFFLQWPSPVRVATQLRLRGDERKMVVTRGEAFRSL